MSEVKQLELKLDDEVIYLPLGVRYRVEHIQKSVNGTPDIEPTYWITPVGRVLKRDLHPIPIPAALTGVYLRSIPKRPTINS